jgi:hypothetical protein
MQVYGKTDWGGQMFDNLNISIKGTTGIDSIHDAITKLLDEKLIQQEIKQNQMEQQNNAQEAKLLADKKKVAADAKKDEKAAGSPRDDAGLEGMDSDESSTVENQPGTKVDTTTSPVPVSKTWFVDNFGMNSVEISTLLVKAERQEMLDLIQPLIDAERGALLESFAGVSPNILKQIPFTDNDWLMLQKNTSTLEIPFRRFVKNWNDSIDDDARESAYSTWSSRITKGERLSAPEMKMLEKAHEVLNTHGSMNSQSLQSHGVKGSTAKISMLIKSHGFLYDIISTGSGSKQDAKSLFYGLDTNDIFIKDAGALIGNLYDMGGNIEVSPRGIPRLILPFESNVKKEYARALNNELGITGVMAEGKGLVIEGEISVSKAIINALPHTNSSELNILKLALEDNDDALKCLTYDLATKNKQVQLLKSWNMSDEGINQLKEDLVNG